VDRLKSFAVCLFVTWSWLGFGQVGSPAGQENLGSATLIHKAANARYDRWEISFHDISLQKQVLWLLAKSEKDQPLNSSSYRIRKKPFDKMGLKDLLCVITYGDKQVPVKKGTINLVINHSRLILEANLKVKGMGIKKYSYKGNYKIIEARR